MSRKTPQRELLTWYRERGRDLPWRRTRDPYRILLSETMLQQTQVDRVVGYYRDFLAAFPDERALADANLDAVHRAWKGLGFPSRAERLRAACRAVVDAGAWPEDPASLRELPGIGPYTAGAVACFAFAKPVPVVDTNIARVYARRDVLPTRPVRRLWEHAAFQVDPGDPIAYTNALMDLGATICTAREPDCPRCPWRARCRAVADPIRWEETGNPLRAATRKKRYGVEISDRRLPRSHVVLALVHDEAGRYLVARRPADLHQGGFWELPGGKRERGEKDRETLARELTEEVDGELLSARPFVDFHHAYDDRYLTFHVYRCRLFDPAAVRPLAADELRWVTPEEFLELEFPPANSPIRDRFSDYHRLT